MQNTKIREKNVSMNVADIVKYHPCIIYTEYMQQICKPLRSLNITYFGHGRIHANGQTTGLSSDPAT